DALALAHLPVSGPARYLLDVDLVDRLQPGDKLIVCGERHALAPLLAGPAESEDIGLRWAGPPRRTGRAVGRTVPQTDTAGLVCTLVLAFVLAVSTLVLWIGLENCPIPRALLRTVSLIATGGSLHEEELRDDRYAWVMVYVSVLRIVGMVLTAAFTAIVT